MKNIKLSTVLKSHEAALKFDSTSQNKSLAKFVKYLKEKYKNRDTKIDQAEEYKAFKKSQ